MLYSSEFSIEPACTKKKNIFFAIFDMNSPLKMLIPLSHQLLTYNTVSTHWLQFSNKGSAGLNEINKFEQLILTVYKHSHGCESSTNYS